MSNSISAIVMTKNEEVHLPECLATLRWADEILVVDSYSTDATPAIAQAQATRLIQHPFRNYADQRNFAQSQARHEWVLFVDADERVPPELRDEIQALATSGKINDNNAYHIQRVHLMLGRWFPNLAKRRVDDKLRQSIRQGEVPRLFKRTQAVWSRPLHETVSVPEPHGVLDAPLLHYNNTNLSLAFASMNDYSDREAAFLYQSLARQVSVFEAIARGLRTFIYVYLVWKWWRYGEAGLLMAINLGFTKFLNYAKAGELARIAANQGIWTDAERQLLERGLHGNQIVPGDRLPPQTENNPAPELDQS